MKIRIMAFVVLLVFTMSGCQSTSDEVYNKSEQGGSGEVDAIGEDNQKDEVTNKDTNENDKEQEDNDSDTEQEESNTDDYITMTMTGYNNGENTDDGMTVQIWYYDPIHDISENKFSFEASAQYSLGYYDKKNETVYYVKRVHMDTFYGDQIFMADLQTGEETQLTEDLFAVNHIIPVEDRIIIVACKRDERPDELGYIDKITHEITFWRDEEDYCVRGISIDREKEQIYISAYLMSERDEIARKPVRENNEIPTYTVFQVNYDLTEDT